MIAPAITLATAAAPANPIPMISTREIAVARDRWLLAVLTLGCVWLAFYGALWLALIGLWHLCRWRDREGHSSLLFWASIGAAWFLLQRIQFHWYEWIAWGWLAIAGAQVAHCVWTWRTHDWSRMKRPSLGRRGKGTLGSPVLTALLFVLVAPFCPWWGWPILATGFYLTCSWSAFLGLGAVVVWLAPKTALLVASSGLLVALAWWWSPTVRGQRLLEWTPRGDSVDGWRCRLVLDRLLLWSWWHGHRWLGAGPGQGTVVARRWSSRSHHELPNGDSHCDPMQLLYEYGLVGALAGLAFVWPILGQLRLGDPWSAAWIAGMGLSLGHYPWRHPVLGTMLLTISARLT